MEEGKRITGRRKGEKSGKERRIAIILNGLSRKEERVVSRQDKRDSGVHATLRMDEVGRTWELEQRLVWTRRYFVEIPRWAQSRDLASRINHFPFSFSFFFFFFFLSINLLHFHDQRSLPSHPLRPIFSPSPPFSPFFSVKALLS